MLLATNKSAVRDQNGEAQPECTYKTSKQTTTLLPTSAPYRLEPIGSCKPGF